ncbi:MAG: hypothetical protein WAQ27_03220 [Candidatus Microsaccharimonas sp.]
MTEQIPDAELPDVEPTRSVEVTINDEDEFKALAYADPESQEVIDWMAAHGLNPGDNVIIHREGQPDGVFTTDSDDFMTRDVEATDTWNDSLNSAKAMLDLEEKIEAEIDERSATLEAESIERGAEQLTFAEAQKIGEPPVELSGIEDPADDEAQQTAEVVVSDVTAEVEGEPNEEALDEKEKADQRTFETKSLEIRIAAAGELAGVVADLSEYGNQFNTDERVLFDGLAKSVQYLGAVIHNGDHSLPAVRTVMEQTVTALNQQLHAGLNIGEHTLGAIDKIANRVDSKLTEYSGHADVLDDAYKDQGAEEGSFETAASYITAAKNEITESATLRQALRDVDSTVQDVIGSAHLQRHIDGLNELIRQSYSHQINTEDIDYIVRSVKLLSQDQEARQKFVAAGLSVNKFLTQVQSAAGKLDPARV